MQGYDTADIQKFQNHYNQPKRPVSAKYPSMNKNISQKDHDLSRTDLRQDKTNSIIKNYNAFSKNSNPNISQMGRRSPILLGQPKQNVDKLFQKQIHIKQMFNDLSEENTKLKTKNAQMEKEISKIEKVMEEMSTLNINAGNRQLIAKWADTSTLLQLKKQAKELKISIAIKQDDITRFKKTPKFNKIEELQIELNTYNEEISKMKSVLSLQINQVEEQAQLNNIINEQENKLYQQQNQIQLLKKDYNDLAEIAKELQQQNEQLQNQINIRNQKNNKQELQELKQELNNLQQKLKQLQVEDFQTLQKKRPQSSQTQKQLEQKKIQELLKQQNEKDQYIQELEEMVQQAQKQESQQNSQIKNQQDQDNNQNYNNQNYNDQNSNDNYNEQQDVESILEDIKYRLLYFQVDFEQLEDYFSELTLEKLQIKPFLLTQQQAELMGEGYLEQIQPYQLFSQHEIQQLQFKISSIILNYKMNFKSYFKFLNQDRVNALDIKKAFKHLSIHIEDRDVEFIIVHTWNYMTAINNSQLQVGGSISWIWIFEAFSEENSSKANLSSQAEDKKKLKRPQSAGEKGPTNFQQSIQQNSYKPLTKQQSGEIIKNESKNSNLQMKERISEEEEDQGLNRYEENFQFEQIDDEELAQSNFTDKIKQEDDKQHQNDSQYQANSQDFDQAYDDEGQEIKNQNKAMNRFQYQQSIQQDDNIEDQAFIQEEEDISNQGNNQQKSNQSMNYIVGIDEEPKSKSLKDDEIGSEQASVIEYDNNEAEFQDIDVNALYSKEEKSLSIVQSKNRLQDEYEISEANFMF